VTLPREAFHDLGAGAVIDLIVARLGLPLYVKPSRGGSALGAGPVRTAAELPAAVLSCFAYGDTALIERLISGTEVAVGVIDLGHGPQALPAVDSGYSMHAPADVTAFAKGASSFGVLDLVGNVSQWTDEYRDSHTRAAILRGGAAYQPSGSIWYFPQTYRLDEHQKYLLMSPGHDRAGTVGFRCVVDAP